MLLSWLGHKHQRPSALRAADAIERAMVAVIEAGDVLTPDLGGNASTQQMGDAVANAVCTLPLRDCVAGEPLKLRRHK
jgi:3-isopropylmalate dehydrogenase